MIYTFPGLAEIDDGADDEPWTILALDALARDLELLDERQADRRHPCDVARDELAARHNALAARPGRADAMLARWTAQVREAQ
jgi:hypothetical protein